MLGDAPATRVPNRGGTSCLLLADAAGNAICVVQSVFNVFGSAFLDPATGIIFNNRMQGFTHRPGRPNSVAPGKRPAAHALPGAWCCATGGCAMCWQAPAARARRSPTRRSDPSLDGGRDVAAAVEAPRWCNAQDGEFLIEGEFPASRLGRARRDGP